MKWSPPDWFAEAVTTYRWLVVGVFAVLAILAGISVPNIRTDFTPSDLFAAFEDQKEVMEEFHDTYGNTDNVVMVLLVGEDVLKQPALQYLHDASRSFGEFERIDQVSSVTVTNIPRVQSEGEEGSEAESEPGGGPTSRTAMLGRVLSGEVRISPIVDGEEVSPEEVDRLKRALQDAPLIEGRLISEDASLAAVTLFLGRDVRRNADIEGAIKRVEDWIEANPGPEGYEVRMAGLPYVRTQVIRKMRSDQTILLPAAVVVSLLILLVAFRWWAAAVFPLVAVGTATVMVVGGMAAVGEPFNVVNNIIPLLIIVIGISDAIHLINRYGEAYAETGDVEEASRRSVRSMATACFLTSFTTAVGFGSLGVANTEILRRFGITAALGVIVVYFVTVLLVPVLLPLAGPPERLARQSTEGGIESTVERLARWLTARAKWVVAAASLLLIVPAVLVDDLSVDNAVLDQLDSGGEVYQTTKLIEEKLYGVRPLEVSLSSKEEGAFLRPEMLNKIERLQEWAVDQEGVLQTSSATDYLHEAWYLATGDKSRRGATFEDDGLIANLRSVYATATRDPLDRYLADEGRKARVSLQLEDVGAKATIVFADRLNEKLDELFAEESGVRVRLTGDAYVASLGLDVVTRDLLWSLATAFLIIFGFLAVVLRSPRLALLSFPSNTLPLLGTLCYMAVRGISINTATAIIFSISLGLAVDGTIHFLARFREETGTGKSSDESLLAAARGTGKAIVLTYLALMLGFSVMLFSSFVPVRRFGELISVTVLLCLGATILLLPPLLYVGWKQS